MDEAREQIANYLTKQFICDPKELPKDECFKEADKIIKMIERLGYRRIDLSKLTALNDIEIINAFVDYADNIKPLSRERAVSEATLAHIKEKLEGK